MVGSSLDFPGWFFLFKVLPEFHLDLLKFINVFVIFFIALSLLLILSFRVVLLNIFINLIYFFVFSIRVLTFFIFLLIVKHCSYRTLFIPIFIHLNFKEINLILFLVFIVWTVFFAVCELNTWYFLTVNHFYQPNYRQNYAQAHWPQNSICEYHAGVFFDRIALQLQHQWNGNHGSKRKLTNYRNDGLEVKSPHSIRNLVNDQHNGHKGKHCPNIHCNKRLKNRPKDNNVSQENGDVEHRVLTLGTCEQNQLVSFVVVNDSVESCDDGDVAEEEKASIERVVVDLSCVSEVWELNVKAEDDFHHCSDDADGKEPVEDHVQEVSPVFDVFPGILKLFLQVFHVDLIVFFGLVFSIPFILLAFTFTFGLLFVFVLFFLLDFFDSFFLPFEPGNSEGDNADDQYDQCQQKEHNVVVENVLAWVLHDSDSVIQHVIGRQVILL